MKSLVLFIVAVFFFVDVKSQNEHDSSYNETMGHIDKITFGFAYEVFGSRTNEAQEKPLVLENDLFANITYHKSFSYLMLGYTFSNELKAKLNANIKIVNIYGTAAYNLNHENTYYGFGLEKPFFHIKDSEISSFAEIGNHSHVNSLKLGINMTLGNVIWKKQ